MTRRTIQVSDRRHLYSRRLLGSCSSVKAHVAGALVVQGHLTLVPNDVGALAEVFVTLASAHLAKAGLILGHRIDLDLGICVLHFNGWNGVRPPS